MVNLLERIRVALPPNRVAAISGFIASLGVAITALAGAFPADNDVSQALVGAAGVIGAVGVVWKFLTGSQQWEWLQNGGAALEDALNQAQNVPGQGAMDDQGYTEDTSVE